jgi:hypothetical protein
MFRASVNSKIVLAKVASAILKSILVEAVARWKAAFVVLRKFPDGLCFQTLNATADFMAQCECERVQLSHANFYHLSSAQEYSPVAVFQSIAAQMKEHAVLDVGQMTPLAAVTLSAHERRLAGIPTNSTHFAWAYPLVGIAEVMLGLYFPFFF